jgi:DNA-binding NtrC family response regulator
MEPSASKPILLCVDANETYLHFRQMVLERAGYSVLTASDSAAAMELFASSTISLVLADDCLRDGSGIELGKAMKGLKPDVLIAIISALAEAPEGMEQADLFISKTESTPQVLQKISELLSGRSDSQQRA